MDSKLYKDNDIAIIGMSGRFPEAADLEQFWQNLASGKESIRQFPKAREEELVTMVGQLPIMDFARGGYLEELGLFEPELFSISREECKYIDPQQRLLLELVEEAILDAGYDPLKFANEYIGVFVSENRYNYTERLLNNSPMATVNSISSSNGGRVAYTYNFHGPVLTIGTACSSSLVALHFACQSIKSEELEMAIVGGTEMLMLPMSKADLPNVSILSPSEQVRAFDNQADGTVFGEGGGILLLKRFTRAVEDGDHIWGVIKGSAIFSDGSWSNGMMSPSEHAQSEVIARALKNSGIDPKTISYVETHGTGTRIGDPIEVAALQDIFDQFGYPAQSVPIGSLKTNIGHLIGAAGVASVIKVVLAMNKGLIPPSLNFAEPNPLIEFTTGSVFVNDRLAAWKSNTVRRAGVTSLGLTGTNTHVILQESPQRIVQKAFAFNKNLVFLQARTEKSLKGIAAKLADHLEKYSDISIDDLAYTLNTGRREQRKLFVTIADNIEELQYNLRKYLLNEPHVDNYLLTRQEKKVRTTAIYIFPDLNNVDFRIYQDLAAKSTDYQRCYTQLAKRVTAKDRRQNQRIEYLLHATATIQLLEKYGIKPKGVMGFGLGLIIANLARKKISFAQALEEIQNNSEKSKVLTEATLHGVVDKIIDSGINLFLLFSPDKKLENLFSQVMAVKKEQFFEVNWFHSDLKAHSKANEEGTTLIFIGETDLSSRIVAGIEEPVIQVRFGPEYKQLDSQHYQITNTPEGYRRLLKNVNQTNLLRIVHLATLTDKKIPSSLAELQQDQDRGIYSLFYLTKGLVDRQLKNKIEIILVADNVNSVVGTEEWINPSQSTLFGLSQAVGQEYPGISSYCIDIDRTTTAEQILNEITTGLTTHTVAYRNGLRYENVFKPLEITKLPEKKMAVVDRGVYVITGGSKGIGLEAAKYLAQQNKVKLALINRSILPNKTEWEEILTRGEDLQLCERLSSLRELESYDVEVNYYSADVSDIEQMAEIFDQLREKYGKINGIIHSAGTAGDGFIATRDSDTFDQILAPKVYGTWILDYLTQDDDLDFFVSFSSIASVLGGAGEGNYVAANSFLDSFSTYRNKLGKRTLTINWASWKETGMARSLGVNYDKVFYSISTLEGIGALHQVLQKDLSQVIIGKLNKQFINANKGKAILPIQIASEISLHEDDSPGPILLSLNNAKNSLFSVIIRYLQLGHELDWEKIYADQKRYRLSLPGYVYDRKRYLGRPDPSILAIYFKETNPQISQIEEMQVVEHPVTTQGVKDSLLMMLREVSVTEELSPENHFTDLDLDSIGILQFVGKIKREYNIDIPLGLFFEEKTIDQIFTAIEDTITDKVQEGNLIPKQPDAEYYPVSSAQRRLFILHQLSPNSINYNLPGALLIEGDFSESKFDQAIQKLVQRHEALRTSIELIDGEPVQKVYSQLTFQIQFFEVAESEVKRTIEEFIRPFDLHTAPLLRMGLIKTGERNYLVYDQHHIISDGFSINILIKDFVRLYAGERLPDLHIQYRDYAVWHNQLLQDEGMKKQEEYWLSQFLEERTNRPIPALNLPSDFPRPQRQSYAGDQLTIGVGQELSARLHKLAKKTSSTLFMVLLSAYNLLLARYTGQDDIIIGTPISGRTHGDLENLIGMFVNTLALRNYPGGDKSYREFLEDLKTRTLAAYENQDYPFEILIEKLNLQRDLSRNPLFDTMFRLQNFRSDNIASEELQCIPYKFETRASQFDLQVTCFEIGDEIRCTFEYSTQLFKTDTVQKMTGHFINLLNGIVTLPDSQLAKIPMLSQKESDCILREFNNTAVTYPKTVTINQLFENQILQVPDNIALVVGDKTVTYAQLNTQANQLARLLRNRGVVRESVVGILAQRSVEMIAALLGVIKAGGAYLPLDPEYPAERIEYMLADSEATILLTQSWLTENDSFTGEKIYLDSERTFTGEITNLENINSAEDLIYLIYTSGSTGKPKGTMLEHRTVHNFITGVTEKVAFTPENKILSLTTISFDIFVLETILPLTRGSRVVLTTEPEQRDPELMSKLISKQQLDMVQITPSRLQLWLEDTRSTEVLEKLQVIFVGGESFPLSLLKRLQAVTQARIFNMYGPTESTVWSTMKELTSSEKVTIGKPIANTQIYILDEYLQPVPINVTGDLYIAGDGLARGYYQRPELTAERFISNPYQTGSKMYKTGDFARWLDNGEIEFLGRRDHQVKIRGYRIEVGEIESALDRYSAVKESLVTAQQSPDGFKYLVAYYLADQEILVSRLRTHLLEILPDYMVPSFYIYLEKFPLTPNGKIDHRQLPELDSKRPQLTEEYQAPVSEVEQIIASVWKERLNLELVGVYDNFFELGGNSMLLVQVYNQLERYFPGKISVADLFAYPTIAKLTGYLERQTEQIEEIDEEKLAAERHYWAQELGKDWELLVFPGEYYQLDNLHEDLDYQFQIQNNVLTQLAKLAVDCQVEIQDILIAMYIYLLSQLSGKKELVIEVERKDDTHKRFPLPVNLQEITDFTDLFTLVNQKYRQAELMGRYPIEQDLRQKSGSTSIIPVIRTSRPGRIDSKDDLYLAIILDEERYTLINGYNPEKLNSGKVEELANLYIKLILSLLDRFYS